MAVSTGLDHIYNAVILDDLETFVSIYEGSDQEEQHRILQGDVLITQVENDDDIHFVNIFNIRRLFHLAVCYCSERILQYMIDKGADPCQVDSFNNSALHYLALMSHLNHMDEASCISAYKILLSLVNKQHWRSLLWKEGRIGAYPIELAATFNCGELFQVIMNTEGVYLMEVTSCGIYDVCWYDVSHYEDLFSSLSRHNVSPLYGFATLDKSMEGLPHTGELFSSQIFQTWATLKIKSVMRCFMMVFILRLWYVCCFVLVDLLRCSYSTNVEDHTNGSYVPYCQNLPASKTATLLGHAYLILHSLASLSFTTCDILHSRKKKVMFIFKTPTGPKKPVVRYFFTLISEVVFTFMILCYECVCVYELTSGNAVNATVGRLLSAFCAIFASISVVYYLQFFETVGFFMVTAQQMLFDMKNFLITFIVFAMPYAYVMSSLISMEHWSQSRRNQTFVENVYFSSYLMSHYSVILMALNMVDFVDMELSDKTIVYIVHFLFIIVVPILLLNLLIAVFSTSVSQITEHKTINLTAHRLNLVWMLENSFSTLCPALLRLLHKDVFHKRKGRICFRIVRIRNGTRPVRPFRRKTIRRPKH